MISKFNNIRFNLFFLFLIGIIYSSYSQDEIITGLVIDKSGSPIPGVNIIEDAVSYNGAVTDFDGNFIIKAKPTSTLIISYVGFITQEIKLDGQKNLNITLEEDLFGLEEVTVVAYGEQKKESVIAAVTSVDPTELRIPTSNLTTSLAGRVAVLISYQRSGEP